MSPHQDLDDCMAQVRTQVPADVLATIERLYAQELQAAGATQVAVSPALHDCRLPMVEREGLSFPVLTDRCHGDQNWDLPVPATSVIAPDQAIRTAFFDPELCHRMEPPRPSALDRTTA